MPPQGTAAIKLPAEEDAQPQERDMHVKDPQPVCGFLQKRASYVCGFV